jgi:hypothetical protein
MACDCIEQLNSACERQGINTVLTVPIIINFQTGKTGPSRVILGVEKRDPKKRERPKPMIPTYCPFCAAKYEDDE